MACLSFCDWCFSTYPVPSKFTPAIAWGGSISCCGSVYPLLLCVSVVDSWIVSTVCPLWMMLLWTRLCKHILSLAFSLGLSRQRVSASYDSSVGNCSEEQWSCLQLPMPPMVSQLLQPQSSIPPCLLQSLLLPVIWWPYWWLWGAILLSSCTFP